MEFHIDTLRCSLTMPGILKSLLTLDIFRAMLVSTALVGVFCGLSTVQVHKLKEEILPGTYIRVDYYRNREILIGCMGIAFAISGTDILMAIAMDQILSRKIPARKPFSLWLLSALACIIFRNCFYLYLWKKREFLGLTRIDHFTPGIDLSFKVTFAIGVWYEVVKGIEFIVALALKMRLEPSSSVETKRVSVKTARPTGIPFLGNAMQVRGKPHVALFNWATKFGSLYTVRFPFHTAVVINDLHLMKEIFSRPESTGCFKTDVLQILAKGPYGIINSEGKTWQEQRRFCLQSLRTFGFGKSAMESLILGEIQEELNFIKEKEGQPIPSNKLFRVSVSNALWSIVIGRKISLADKDLSALPEDLLMGMQKTVQTGVFFVSWIKYFAPNRSGYNWLVKRSMDLQNFIQKTIHDHKASYVQNAPRDIIDFYLDNIQNTVDPSSSLHGISGEKHAVVTIAEIFVAGGATMSQNLRWILLYLSQFLIIQNKLREEVLRVIGSDEEPSIQDRLKMPYTEAVILEIFRITSIGPFGVVHTALEDISLKNEYSIPKGTLLIPNIYYIHHNKEIWGDPEQFRPERFLTSENLVDSIKAEFVIPFQVGRRKCLGESLARDVTFLYVTKLLQMFELLPDSNKPNFQPNVGYGMFSSTRCFKTDVLQILSKEKYGIISSEGKIWQEQRRFCLQSLRTFGFGKSAKESLILGEIQDELNFIQEKEGQAIPSNKFFRVSVSNALWSILIGRKISLTEKNLCSLPEDLLMGVQKTVQTGVFFLSWIKYFAPNRSGYNWLAKRTQDLKDFIQKTFNDHKSSFVQNAPRDIIDFYIEKIENTVDPSSSLYGKSGGKIYVQVRNCLENLKETYLHKFFNRKHAIVTIAEIFVAGGATMSQNLRWIILYLSQFPSVQTKLRDEILRVIGNDKEPSIEDRLKMPYTEAVILEIFRITSFGPVGVVHTALKDIILRNKYDIPKGTLLIPNIYHIHHGKKLWGDPEQFRPERFLTPEQLLDVRKAEFVIPFQVGRRQCLGESLARDVTFLYVTKLLQIFELSSDPSAPKPDIRPDVGIGMLVKPFNIIMKSRNMEIIQR
ncbi:unnamed protein product [Orchesella dallaii]|uniref:Uncharacterized protein n=1 Tax=Orchesella dallaii TaxID=48710 RepID=A0ABP1RUW4_9HEXA